MESALGRKSILRQGELVKRYYNLPDDDIRKKLSRVMAARKLFRLDLESVFEHRKNPILFSQRDYDGFTFKVLESLYRNATRDKFVPFETLSAETSMTEEQIKTAIENIREKLCVIDSELGNLVLRTVRKSKTSNRPTAYFFDLDFKPSSDPKR